MMRWHNLVYQNYKCVKCGNNRGMENHNDFVTHFNKLKDCDDYKILTDFVNVKTKIKLKHKVCGHEYYVLPLIFLGYKNREGTRCKVCTSKESAKKRIGELNPSWKGGITPLKNHIRNSLILEWKKDSMKNCNYKCVITCNPFSHIHHLYSFTKIFEETMNELKIYEFKEISEYTSDELEIIKCTMLNNHYKYGLGVCLTKEVHDLFHRIYGKVDCGKDDFIEFKNDCLSGKYNKELNLKMGVS